MSPFECLKQISLTDEQQVRLHVGSSELALRRTSPRSETHLLVEYATTDGQRIAGQWFREPERSQAIAGKMLDAALPCVVWTDPHIPTTKLVLQARGADRKMPGLLALVAEPGAELLVHHPERRAVVRLARPEGPLYARIVPPERLAARLATWQTIRLLADAAFATPRLVAVDPTAGISVWSALPGVSLNDLLASESLAHGARKAGMALAALHAAEPSHLPLHSSADEAALLHTWVTRTLAFFPALGRRLVGLPADVQARLNSSTTSSVTLHRDFYDKQIFVDANGAGILDFDTLAGGEAALDLGNVLAHFELRALQGCCSAKRATIAASALLAGYQPDQTVYRRIPAYMNAARLRLACVYAFRPAWQHLPAILLDRVKQDLYSDTARHRTCSRTYPVPMRSDS